MASRYKVKDGIVIRRHELPKGDVIITLMSQQGKWRALARKGKRLGGTIAKLSLFNDVTVQFYQKPNDELAILTQVQLNGALTVLSTPNVYPYAHILAELVDKLGVDSHVGEPLYSYLASGLRGLCQHKDPSMIAVIYSWKLIQQAGFAPQLFRCAKCGAAETSHHFDIAAGGLTCATCHLGTALPATIITDLKRILHKTVRESLDSTLDTHQHWSLLRRYLHYHVAALNSFVSLMAIEGNEHT